MPAQPTGTAITIRAATDFHIVIAAPGTLFPPRLPHDATRTAPSTRARTPAARRRPLEFSELSKRTCLSHDGGEFGRLATRSTARHARETALQKCRDRLSLELHAGQARRTLTTAFTRATSTALRGMRVVEEEAEHLARCVRPARVRVGAVRAATRPSVDAAVNDPLLQHRASGGVNTKCFPCSPWPCSNTPRQHSTNVSATPDENASRRSITPTGCYLSRRPKISEPVLKSVIPAKAGTQVC